MKKKILEEMATCIELIKEDFALARLLSRQRKSLGIRDCLHIAVCKRTGCILITRDKKLLSYAKYYVIASLPEDLT